MQMLRPIHLELKQLPHKLVFESKIRLEISDDYGYDLTALFSSSYLRKIKELSSKSWV
jgi:hypothetical protein